MSSPWLSPYESTLIRAVCQVLAHGTASLAVTTSACPADEAPAASDNLSCMNFQIMGGQYTRLERRVNTSSEHSVHKIGTLEFYGFLTVSGRDLRTDFNQASRSLSCSGVKSSAPAIKAIVSITRARIAGPIFSSGRGLPFPKSNHSGVTCVASAIAIMSLRFGLTGSDVSRRCSPVFDRLIPLSARIFLNAAGASPERFLASRMRLEMPCFEDRRLLDLSFDMSGRI